MNTYAQEARERYLRHIAEKEREYEIEKERENEIERQKQKIEDDHNFIYKQIEEWDKAWEQGAGDVIFTLHLLYSILTDHLIHLAKQYDRLDELQERVVRLVNELNDRFSENKPSLEEIREIYSVMRLVIEKTETDIPIEIMDTSGDAELSEKLQKEEEMMGVYYNYNNIPIPIEEKVEEEKKEEDENLPIVYLSSRVNGIRLVELKEIAKKNGFSYNRSKNDLALFLQSKGLVRVVE
jgi:hypothetical protein